MQVHRQHAQRQTKHSQIVFHFVPPKGICSRACGSSAPPFPR
jgi:hypothetical protein